MTSPRLETAAHCLTECGQPVLPAAIGIELPKPKTWMILRGMRLVEKVQAGRAILRLRKTRSLMVGEVDITQPPALMPWRWHDAEGLVRIGLHPVTFFLILAWNFACIIYWLQMRFQ